MLIQQETQFYWELMQSLKQLQGEGSTVTNDQLYAELVDELVVMHMHTESARVRHLVAQAIVRFTTAPARYTAASA